MGVRWSYCVSIRAPARGATRSRSSTRPHRACFNPAPPHGGRQDCRAACAIPGVSIRAPARGATPSFVTWHLGQLLFQSAPPHGGRPACVLGTLRFHRFNPRPRTGGDDRITGYSGDLRSVSIRAPARGATSCAVRCSPIRRFNPRPRTGGDSTTASRMTKPKSFQSAPPHGGRPL